MPPDKVDDTGVWQDTEIRFDSPVKDLALRPGEVRPAPARTAAHSPSSSYRP